MLSNVGNPSGLSGFFIMWNADGKPLECKWMCFQECGRQIVLIDVLSFFLLTFRFYSIFTFSVLTWTFLPYSGWAFSGLLKDGGSQKGTPLPKICLTYPTVMKLGTVIPYLKKIQRVYEPRPLNFADINIFSPEISKFCYIKKYRYRLHFDT